MTTNEHDGFFDGVTPELFEDSESLQLFIDSVRGVLAAVDEQKLRDMERSEAELGYCCLNSDIVPLAEDPTPETYWLVD